MQVLYLHLAWPNYGLDGLNITMHIAVLIPSMCGVGSLDEIPSVTMGRCK